MTNQSPTIKKVTLVAILNIFWFSLWFLLIFWRGITPLWFLFPAFIHWKTEDVEK